MNKNFFDVYLNKLEELYSYPKVQIERAISPLLSIFITDIINDSLKTKIKLSLPEFPFKKDYNFQSNNIDWLLIDEENYTLYFIEFKTTSSNIKPTQLDIYDDILDTIRKKNSLFLLEDLRKIRAKSKKKIKYNSILDIINDKDKLFNSINKCELIYFGPKKLKSKLPTGTHIITFSGLSADLASNFSVEWKKIREYLITIDKIDSN